MLMETTLPLATNPSCPKALLQFQHGTYTIVDNGSLILYPFEVDGRQLWSDPCSSSTGVYTRYNQTELFKWWEIVLDEYHGRYRLNMYKFDGAPMNPLYVAPLYFYLCL